MSEHGLLDVDEEQDRESAPAASSAVHNPTSDARNTTDQVRRTGAGETAEAVLGERVSRGRAGVNERMLLSSGECKERLYLLWRVP